LAPISRIELSKRTYLAAASIIKIVRELPEVHLVNEVECQDIGNLGRPAIGLVLAPEAWHYLSARLLWHPNFVAVRSQQQTGGR